VLEYLPISEDFTIVELAPPRRFIGKALPNSTAQEIPAAGDRHPRRALEKLQMVPRASSIIKDSDVLVIIRPGGRHPENQIANELETTSMHPGPAGGCRIRKILREMSAEPVDELPGDTDGGGTFSGRWVCAEPAGVRDFRRIDADLAGLVLRGEGTRASRKRPGLLPK